MIALYFKALMVFGGCSTMLLAQQNCMVIGHRGACGYAPENSRASFKKAIELRVDMVEFDVHRCASGELVVIHDDTLHRTTDSTGYIKDFTIKDLQQVLLQDTTEHIPTLEEAIETIGHSAKIAIELKGQGTAVPTANVVQWYLDNGWHSDEFFILSFDHKQLEEFHALLPHIKRCATVYGLPLHYAAYAKKHGFDAVATCYSAASQEFIDDAHAHGLKVFIYTANDPRIIKELLLKGVDGIFSDYPDRIQQALKANL